MTNNNNNNNSQRFTAYRAVTPFYVLYDLDLNANHLRLYGQIEQMESNPNPSVQPSFSYSWIGQQLGMNRRSAMKVAKLLTDKGYIEHKEIKKGQYVWSLKKAEVISEEKGSSDYTPTSNGVPQRHQGGVPQRHQVVSHRDTQRSQKLRSQKNINNKTLVDFDKSPSEFDDDEFEMYAGTFEYHGEVFEGYSNLVDDYVGFDEEDITTLEPVISPEREVSVVSDEVVKAEVVAEVAKEPMSDYRKNRPKNKPNPPKTKHSLKDYEKDVRFMAFYGLYPNKKKPWFAYKAFLQLHPNDELLKRLIADVKARYATEWKNRPKKMIPHPATYLNKGEWEGEIDDYSQEENTQQYVPTYTYGHGLGTDMMKYAI